MADNPKTRAAGLRRIPAFHPVPLRVRRDGWTPLRQAEFIGYLAETRSVSEAARRVGRSRESAYRLRRKTGAEGFAAVWDIAMGRELSANLADVTRAARKVTPELLWQHALSGKMRPVMRAGKHVTVTQKPDNSALLQHLGQLDRACRGIDERAGIYRRSQK